MQTDGALQGLFHHRSENAQAVKPWMPLYHWQMLLSNMTCFCSTVKSRSLYNIMFFFNLQPDFHSMLEFHRLCSPGSFLLTLLHTPLWSCLRLLAVVFTSAVYPVSVPACMWQIKFVNWNHFKIGEMGNWVTKSKLTAAAGIEKIGSPKSWFAFRWWI